MKTSGSYTKTCREYPGSYNGGVFTSQIVDAQGWLDNDWPYRRSVAISNPAGTELSDFQVQIILNSGNFDFSAALTDGSDMRVAASDGTTPVPYWIETWDATGQMAVIWVKVPLLPAGRDNDTFILREPGTDKS